MTTRDIQSQLQDLYDVTVSHTLVSTVTEAVEAERKAWHNWSLDGLDTALETPAILPPTPGRCSPTNQIAQGITERLY